MDDGKTCEGGTVGIADTTGTDATKTDGTNIMPNDTAHDADDTATTSKVPASDENDESVRKGKGHNLKAKAGRLFRELTAKHGKVGKPASGKPCKKAAESPVIRSLRHRLTVIIMLLAGSIVLTSIAVSAISSYSRMSSLVDQSLRKGLSEESIYRQYGSETGASQPSGGNGAANGTGNGTAPSANGNSQGTGTQSTPPGMGMEHLPVLWFDLDTDWIPTASNLGMLSFDYDDAIACIDAAQDSWENQAYAAEIDPSTHGTVDVISGSLNGMHLTYRAISTTDGWRIAIVDTTSTDDAIAHQLGTDALLLVASTVMLLVAARWLSGRLVAPVSDAWERQRRFVADASHELKTPLAVIMANTQILESEKKMPASTKRWVTGTTEEAERMRGLVEGLLELARTEDAGANMVREKVSWSDVVDDEVLQFDSVAYERGCELEDDVTDGIEVMGDRAQLDRLVRTLLDNATKYADNDTKVTVALRRDGKRNCVLTVTNMCKPMSVKDVEHVFDRFWRSDESRTRTERGEVGGYGLGLAIAKGIAEGHGGYIKCESDTEHGTRFTVTLPTV